MAIELTHDIAPFSAAFLDLEYAASEPYSAFTYETAAQARTAQRVMLDAGAEFSPPHGRAAVDGDRIVGMMACLTASDLRTARLRGAMALRRASLLANPDVRRRTHIAGEALATVEDRDYYLSRLAVMPDERGRGVGAALLGRVEEEALAGGFLRVVLEVSDDDPAATAFIDDSGIHLSVAELPQTRADADLSTCTSRRS